MTLNPFKKIKEVNNRTANWADIGDFKKPTGMALFEWFMFDVPYMIFILLFFILLFVVILGGILWVIIK